MAKWMLAARSADFQLIAETFEISPIVARLLRNRGLTTEREISYYLEGALPDLHASALLQGAEEAAAILRDKIHAGKKICVIGDYDVDGICATHILMTVLRRLGAEAEAVLPDRITDGYGMNQRMVTEAAASGVDTIITCDNGIAASVPVKVAGQLGLTVLVTDHHEVPVENDGEGGRRQILPPAAVVVDPKIWGETGEAAYPFPDICGAVVAYKVMDLLLRIMRPAQAGEILEELLPFAALATVCDVMPLLNENRILVKEGLLRMRSTDNVGLRALLEVTDLAGKEITAYHAGFILGPCLNASGRLDNAIRAFRLFQMEDRAEALQAAQALKELNDSRKSMTLRGVELAERSIAAGHLLENPVLVVYLPDTHESLAGIIAGRLRETYSCPVFVLTDAEDGLIKGSGRSVEGYDMVEALRGAADCLVRFGGHKMAAGLTLERKNMAALIRTLNEQCTLTPDDLVPVLHIDMELPPSLLDLETVRSFSLLEPCGKDNPRPLFATRDVLVTGIRLMGKTNRAARLSAKDQNGANITLLYFSDPEKLKAKLDDALGAGTFAALTASGGMAVRMKVAYQASVREWHGEESVQLVISDIQV